MAVAKTEEIIKEIYKSGTISEKELNLLKNRANRGENVDLDYSIEEDVKLTKDQFNKGLKWLKNQMETPTGKERKNNPFRLREMEAIKNCKEIYFLGFTNAGNFFSNFYVPVYYVQGKEEWANFEYYLAGGKINIIG